MKLNKNDVYIEIKNDRQIKKFCLYGLLKNLKFFEPYLLIYLLGLGFSLFQIGVLYAIREAITYIFEVPSGIIADHWGKKKELMMCFIFYILAFIFFFIGYDFMFVTIGMLFFGLGEAFRSGTHKAMIYTYLEEKEWFSYKSFVYGRTRSYSLFGSAFSAFLSIVFILNIPSTRWIFILCIIPYIIHFILIYTYPAYFDEKKECQLTVKSLFKESCSQLKCIGKQGQLKKVILSSSAYDSVFKTLKDYIQPILLLGAGGVFIQGLPLDQEGMTKVYLGIVYGIFYLCSSLASKNVYKLNKWMSSKHLMVYSFDLMGILMMIIALAMKVEMKLVVIGLYLLMYVLKDGRRPIVVDVLGDYMKKSQRATVLSIDSQLRAFFIILLAPASGWVADQLSIEVLFVLIGLIMLVLNRFLALNKINNSNHDKG